MMQSSNPVLSGNLFRSASISGQAMTLRGAVEKTGILFLCLLISAGFTWYQFLKTGNVQAVTPWMLVGAIGGFITAIVTVFKKEWASFSAPIYAILEGFFIGGISSVLEVQFPGIVIQAAGATFAVMAVMLFLYESQWIEVTQKFRLGVVAATGGIALFYFVAIIFSFFGMPFSILWSNGIFGILFFWRVSSCPSF